MALPKRVLIVNSSENPKNGLHVENGAAKMLKRKCAAAWTTYRHERCMRETRGGDGVLLYVNGRGVIAYGIAGKQGFEPVRDKSRRINLNGRDDNGNPTEEHQVRVSWTHWLPPGRQGYPLRHRATAATMKKQRVLLPEIIGFLAKCKAGRRRPA